MPTCVSPVTHKAANSML